MMKRILPILTLFIFLSACHTPAWGNRAVTAKPAASAPSNPVDTLTSTVPLKPRDTPAASQTIYSASTPPAPTITLAPDAWKSMPIVPVVSPAMLEVYRLGLAAGRDPTRFSKIGDCQNITTYFLASFDNPNDYRLGSTYAYLQPTIDHFAGSWSRESLAVKGGMNVAAVQNPFWTLTPRPDECKEGETPMACEIRVNNPSFAIISMEESWSGDISKYDSYMRKIVEYLLSQDVIPILATRAEEPDPKVSIDATVAQIAYDYQVPLWNFWAATYPLPSHGLTQDGFHLTQGRSFFDDPARMEMGWPWRNLTALQAIDAVYRAVSGQY